jgi:hypothetical protein
MRFKIDTGIVEDDLQWLPNAIVALWKQHGDSPVRIRVAGADPLLEISHEELNQAMNEQFIFRGPTRAEDPNMLVQQLNTILPNYMQDLQPDERRKALAIMLEALDVQGVGSILTPQQTQQAAAQGAQNNQLANAQGQAALTQAQAVNAQRLSHNPGWRGASGNGGDGMLSDDDLADMAPRIEAMMQTRAGATMLRWSPRRWHLQESALRTIRPCFSTIVVRSTVCWLRCLAPTIFSWRLGARPGRRTRFARGFWRIAQNRPVHSVKERARESSLWLFLSNYLSNVNRLHGVRTKDRVQRIDSIELDALAI